MATCANPPEIENGHVSHTNSFDSGKFAVGGWTNGEVIEYKCYRHYALYDEYQVKCTGGQWQGVTSTGVLPKCKYSMATESKCVQYYEPHREKTGLLPMRKQRRRSASQ